MLKLSIVYPLSVVYSNLALILLFADSKTETNGVLSIILLILGGIINLCFYLTIYFTKSNEVKIIQIEKTLLFGIIFSIHIILVGVIFRNLIALILLFSNITVMIRAIKLSKELAILNQGRDLK